MPKILVIDDDADFRTVLKQELSDLGYETALAPDGVWGFQKVLDVPVDLILLDWNMPHRGGLETLRLVRSVQPHIPVIIVTALLDDASRAAAQQLGVTEVIFKPVSIKNLIGAVRRTVGPGQA